MRFICVYFGGEKYTRLARALEYSIAVNVPGANIIMIEGDRPSPYVAEHGGKITPFYMDNTYKLELWYQELLQSNEPTVFMDADMVVLKDLTHVFDGDFDIAITERKHRRHPGFWFNGGVIYVKPNMRSLAFFRRWVERNDYLLKHPDELKEAQEVCWGMNQAAFMSVYNEINGNTICHFKKLPAKIYNCCDSHWHEFDPDKTAVLHIKGVFREMIWGGCEIERMPKRIKTPASHWYKYDIAG